MYGSYDDFQLFHLDCRKCISFLFTPSGRDNHLEDPNVLIYKFTTKRTISYAVMTLSNIGKVVSTNVNVFAINLSLGFALLKNTFFHLKDVLKFERECHNYVMKQLCEEYSKHEGTFRTCLNKR